MRVACFESTFTGRLTEAVNIMRKRADATTSVAFGSPLFDEPLEEAGQRVGCD